MADSVPTVGEIMNKFNGADDMLAYVKSFHGTRIEVPKTPAATPQNPTPQTPAQITPDVQAEALKEIDAKRAPAVVDQTVDLDNVQYDLNPQPKKEIANGSTNIDKDNDAGDRQTSSGSTVKQHSVGTSGEDRDTDTSGEGSSDEGGGETGSADDTGVEGGEADPKLLNFKKLRSTLREKDLELRSKLKELEDVTNKVKKYETGEELPEPVRHLEERVRELEPYERLHALKLSPAYKEAFVKPVQEIRAKVSEIAADYNIPEDVMNQAFNIGNKADLNRFLSSHFDDVGALEVKQLITQAQDVTARARQAEEEPSQAMAALDAEYHNLQNHRKAQRNSIIASTSKDGWAEALMQIKDEGKALELIYKDGDSEHNKTYVEPVVRKAASEYGKIVTMLAENGLEHLPKDLAKALARMVQLAHASAIAIETRAAAERELNEISENNTRNTRYIRPSIGGGVGSNGVTSSKPKNLSDAVDQLVSKVISR